MSRGIFLDPVEIRDKIQYKVKPGKNGGIGVKIEYKTEYEEEFGVDVFTDAKTTFEVVFDSLIEYVFVFGKAVCDLPFTNASSLKTFCLSFST